METAKIVILSNMLGYIDSAGKYKIVHRVNDNLSVSELVVGDYYSLDLDKIGGLYVLKSKEKDMTGSKFALLFESDSGLRVSMNVPTKSGENAKGVYKQVLSIDTQSTDTFKIFKINNKERFHLELSAKGGIKCVRKKIR